MDTYATLKRMVANRLGLTDNASAVPLRDNAIIDAVKQIYQDSNFSWLLKTADISLTAGVGNLPSNFNVNFGIKSAYEVIAGTANDHRYVRIPPEDFDFYTASDYFYYVTWNSTDEVFVLTTNQTSNLTLRIWYWSVPADLSASDDVTPIPDSIAIRDLAVANYWLAAERDEDEHDRWYKHYQERLAGLINNDRSYNTERRGLTSLIDTTDNETTLAVRR